MSAGGGSGEPVADPVTRISREIPLARDTRRGRIWLAIARMQFRAFLNSMRRGAKKDPVPAAFSVIITVGTLLTALVIAGAMGVTVSVSAALAPEMLFWTITVFGTSALIFSLLSAVSGEASGVADARSLQLFPLPRAALARMDLAAAFLAPSVLLFAPAFVAIAVGSLVGRVLGGKPLLALPSALGAVGMFLADVALVRAASSWIASGGRRMREWLTLTFVSAFVAGAYLLPELEHVNGQRLDQVEWVLSLVARATWLGAGADLVAGGRPSFGAAAVSAGSWGLLLDAVVLASWLALLLGMHARVTRRVLDGEGGYHSRRVARRAGPAKRGLITRILPAPILGVAATDLRTMLRVPMMWILLFMPALFGIFIGGRNSLAPDPHLAEQMAGWTLPFAALGSHILFSSQLFANLFGIDRDAAAMWLLAPVRPRELFVGKILARLVFGSMQVLAFLGALSLRTPGSSHADVLRAYAAWLASAAWVASLGMILSVRLPVRLTFGQQREQRFERAAVTMLGQAAVAVVLIAPASMILGGKMLAGTAGYTAGIAVTGVSGVLVWLFSSMLATTLFDARGVEMVDGLSAKG